MMQIKELVASYNMQGEHILTITLNKAENRAIAKFLEGYDKNVPYELEIAKKRKKRSNDANAKAWVLLGKLAEEMSKETPVSAEELYRDLIDRCSKGQIIPVKAELVDRWVDIWEHSPKTKIGWISKVLGDSKLKGYVNTINWYGSSCFDTVEMAKLLNAIVEECKLQGIETDSPEEIERLLSLWGK